MNMTETQLKAEIKKNLEKAAELEATLKALQSLTPIQRLAIAMFRGTGNIRADTDWWYHYKNGVPLWSGSEQPRWLSKAHQYMMLIGASNDTNIDKHIQFFENYRIN